MFSPLLTFILFMGAAQFSCSSFQTFSTIKQLPDMENNIAPLETSNRISLQSNKILECDMEDVFETVGFNDLQDLIQAVASRKGISPYAVLRMLYKRMKNQEEIEEKMLNSIEALPLPDIFNPPIMDVPSPVRVPTDSDRTPYSVPSHKPMNGEDDDETKVVIIPVAPPPPLVQNSFPNRLPPVMKPDIKSRNEGPFIINNIRPPVGKISHVLPAVFPLLAPVKSNHLRPPAGAIVRINSGDPHSPIDSDITVTVSPLMTFIEALRQAETKYQNVLGLNHDLDIFGFAHSSAIDCYIVNRVNNIIKSEDSAWKVTIVDRDGQVVYDNFCLPNGKDVLIKPGTMISLSYVPL